MIKVVRPAGAAAGADDGGPAGADGNGPAKADTGAEAENSWAKSSGVDTDVLRTGDIAGALWGVAGGPWGIARGLWGVAGISIVSPSGGDYSGWRRGWVCLTKSMRLYSLARSAHIRDQAVWGPAHTAYLGGAPGAASLDG